MNRSAARSAAPRDDHPVVARSGRSRRLPAIRLHDARHTAATVMLRAGVPVKVVSQRLGHADVAVTMRVYQHVTAQDDRPAVKSRRRRRARPCSRGRTVTTSWSNVALSWTNGVELGGIEPDAGGVGWCCQVLSHASELV